MCNSEVRDNFLGVSCSFPGRPGNPIFGGHLLLVLGSPEAQEPLGIPDDLTQKFKRPDSEITELIFGVGPPSPLRLP